jgi:hypothetical protein
MIPGVPAYAQPTFDLTRTVDVPGLAAMALGMMAALTTPARPWFHLELEPEGRFVPWDVRWELHP